MRLNLLNIHTYSSVNKKNLCKKRTLYKDECSGILDFPLSNIESEFKAKKLQNQDAQHRNKGGPRVSKYVLTYFITIDFLGVKQMIIIVLFTLVFILTQRAFDKRFNEISCQNVFRNK